ncbi:MAG: right-handed parallel beta-helix repeat-containing protein [Verrucomicrobiaceae bacterium]|nr:right-handed parallel beta-helix repeat-containing protein [Verrucomicrobiaceae bacterium]
MFRFSLLFLTLASLSPADDFFVAVSGNDAAAGTKDAPWRTVQHACDALKPGDTAHVLAGTYKEKIRFRTSGKPGLPLTLKAEGAAVISGRDVDGENIVLIENQSHIRLVGFELRDHLRARDGSGVRVRGACSHIEIRNCRIHEIRGKDAMGITVYGTSETPVSDLVIDGNEIFNCAPARSEALTLNGNVAGFQVTNNYIHDVNNIGIDFIGGEAWMGRHPERVARQGVCRGNRVERCRSSYEGGYAAGIYVDGGKDIVIEDNLVMECDLGIEVGAENRGTVTTGITVKNNRIFNNDKAGLVFGGFDRTAGRVKDCIFTGNTCYRNDRHRKDQNGELWIQAASDNKITGNVFWSGEETPLVQVDVTAGDNVIDRNRYFSEAGAADCYFNWRGRDVDGFAAWKKISRQDAGSEFQRPDIQLPAVK